MSEKSKTLLAKVRFIEALSLRRDLHTLDLRLAIMLISLCSTRHKCAWPTLTQISETLNADKRHVHRAISRLEERGVFEVRRPERQGRGRANEYTPNWSIIPDGNVYELRKVPPMPPLSGESVNGEKVPWTQKKGAMRAKKGGAHGTPSEESTTEEEYIRPSAEAHLQAGAPSPGAVFDMPDHQILGTMKTYEKAVKAGEIEPGRTDWKEFLEEVSESFPTPKGHGIGGMAYRLLSEWIEI